MNLPLWRIAEFIAATGDFVGEVTASGYSIDSRTVKSGDLFFAVRGERLDGHDFVESALENGAVGAVVSKKQAGRYHSLSNLMRVETDDALPALQALGKAARKLWGRPLIAVTGSAGKTTTKEAIYHLLSTRRRVMKSEGNLNNHFGLPLQLLRLQPEHELAVVELGMNHAGEIAALAHLACPDVGVVTCVAPVHLEFFDSVASIAKAKYELIQALPHGGTAVLNADDDYVSQFGRDFHGKVITFGMRHPADVRAEHVTSRGQEGSHFELIIDSVRESASLPLLGSHNIMNALAAVAVALQFGITPSEAAAALARLKPADKRGQVLSIAGATLINDCYNSNPTALRSMVDTLAAMPAERRIIVAGEMLELGPESAALHRDCGEYLADKADLLIGVQGMAEQMVQAASARGISATFLQTPQEAGAWLGAELRPGDAVLLKASRGVRLERALESLREKMGEPA